ncbi:hypothetical protein QZH41_010291, partial [Actinostola sp. cb2023]
MSYIHIPHSRPLDHMTAFQILQTHAKQRPNKEALVFRDEKLNRVSLTFQEYDTKSSSLAAGLLEIGLVRGDKVLVLLPSYLEFVLFHMALNRIGAIMITIEENCYLAVCGVPDLACVIARVEPTVTDNDKVIGEIKKALHQNMLKAAILVGSDGDAESLDNSKAYTHEKLFAMAEKNPENSTMVQKAEAQVQMDDPCLVIFTSGSTSIPKPIQYTHHGYVNGVYADIDISELTQDSIFFSDSPFDWISGVAFSLGPAIVLGLTYVVFPPKLAITGKHVMTIMKIVEQEAITHAVFLLYLLQDIMLYKEEIIDKNLTKLKVVITGGQPTPLPVMKKLLDIWPDLTAVNSYGSTESSLMTKQRITKDNVDSIDYGVMEIVPGLEMKVVNEQGQLMPIGEAGEICVRSAWISFCNWDFIDIGKGQEDTSKKSNGWHSTKDVGIVVNSNCIRLLGRIDFND